MITREQYLEALEVVDKYHKQSIPNNLTKNLKSWNDLSVGDFIVFSSTMSKNIIVGKTYEVVYVDADFCDYYRSWFGIIGEDGKRKSLRKYANGYRMGFARI